MKKLLDVLYLFALLFLFAILFRMAEFTWGDLPKSQIDNQLITEAIDAAILAHEEDPEAHLGDGESLEQHKNNEVLDHLALSIVPDKLRFRIYTPSLITDGFNGEFTSPNVVFSGILNNGFTIYSVDDENFCYMDSQLGGLESDWSADNIFFETIARASTGGGFHVKWKTGFGTVDLINFEGSDESWPGIGFYFDANTLKIYAYYVDSSLDVQKHEVVSAYTLSFYKLNIELRDGVIYYYVDDLLVWTVESPTFASYSVDTSALFFGTDYRFDSEPFAPTFNIKYVSFSQPNPY